MFVQVFFACDGKVEFSAAITANFLVFNEYEVQKKCANLKWKKI